MNNTIILKTPHTNFYAKNGQNNTVSYIYSARPLNLNLTAGTASYINDTTYGKISGMQNVIGSQYNDIITSISGTSIDGGSGNDTIILNPNSTGIGGQSADIFVINSGQGEIQIKDFVKLEGDKINISAFQNITKWSELLGITTKNGNNLKIKLNYNTTLILENRNQTDIDRFSFIPTLKPQEDPWLSKEAIIGIVVGAVVSFSGFMFGLLVYSQKGCANACRCLYKTGTEHAPKLMSGLAKNICKLFKSICCKKKKDQDKYHDPDPNKQVDITLSPANKEMEILFLKKDNEGATKRESKGLLQDLKKLEDKEKEIVQESVNSLAFLATNKMIPSNQQIPQQENSQQFFTAQQIIIDEQQQSNTQTIHNNKPQDQNVQNENTTLNQEDLNLSDEQNENKVNSEKINVRKKHKASIKIEETTKQLEQKQSIQLHQDQNQESKQVNEKQENKQEPQQKYTLQRCDSQEEECAEDTKDIQNLNIQNSNNQNQEEKNIDNQDNINLGQEHHNNATFHFVEYM